MPRFGLGVYRTKPGSETRRAVASALACGYRHVDTARIYDNERDVGSAIRESGIPRHEIFVSTKLWNADHGRSKPLRACEASLGRLGLDFVDLYLIHWPVERLRGESWEAMRELLEQKRCRAVGVSNYTVRHLEELLRGSSSVPAVNQVECSPFLTQERLRDFCVRQGIQVEAYSSLTKGKRLGHATLRELADRYGKSPAQILIRWALQHDLVVIPKSKDPARIRENADVFDFEIGQEDMALLDGLDENLHTSWDPTDAP